MFIDYYMKDNSKNSLVSIITPVYNHEPYLEQYFESLIIQDYKNIELIIVDDASSDKSWKIIEKKEKILDERNIKTKFLGMKVTLVYLELWKN